MDEAEVEINGTRLNAGHVMTLRTVCVTALENFENNPDALGDDDHGRRMVAAYSARLRELLELMSSP